LLSSFLPLKRVLLFFLLPEVLESFQPSFPCSCFVYLTSPLLQPCTPACFFVFCSLLRPVFQTYFPVTAALAPLLAILLSGSFCPRFPCHDHALSPLREVEFPSVFHCSASSPFAPPPLCRGTPPRALRGTLSPRHARPWVVRSKIAPGLLLFLNATPPTCCSLVSHYFPRSPQFGQH